MASRSLLLLVLLCLSLILVGTLFLYWRERNELEEMQRSNNALKGDLTMSRSERDEMKYRLDLLNGKIEMLDLRRSKMENHQLDLTRAVDDQVQDERKLVSLE